MPLAFTQEDFLVTFVSSGEISVDCLEKSIFFFNVGSANH